jgi:hypothetical protein
VATLIDALIGACEGSPTSVAPLSNFGVAKTSKLPTWMQPVPQAGLSTTPRTREAGVGPVVNEPEPPWYGPTIPGTQIPMPSGSSSAPWPPLVPAQASTATVTRTHHARTPWPVRFISWTFKFILFSWWVPLLAAGLGLPLATAAWGFLILCVLLGLVCANEARTPATPSSVPALPRPAHPPWSQSSGAPNNTTTAGGSHQTTPGSAVVASSIRAIYHKPSCEWALKMRQRNKVTFPSASVARSSGYRACKICRP